MCSTTWKPSLLSCLTSSSCCVCALRVVGPENFFMAACLELILCRSIIVLSTIHYIFYMDVQLTRVLLLQKNNDNLGCSTME